MAWLANAFQIRNEHGKAEELFLVSLDRGQKAWSRIGWNGFLAVYAKTLIALGKYDEAKDLLLGESTIAVARGYSGHSQIICNLVKHFQRRNEHAKAEGLFRRLLDIRPEAWSRESWDRFLVDFVETLTAIGKNEEARDIEHQRIVSAFSRQRPTRCSSASRYPKPPDEEISFGRPHSCPPYIERKWSYGNRKLGCEGADDHDLAREGVVG